TDHADDRASEVLVEAAQRNYFTWVRIPLPTQVGVEYVGALKPGISSLGTAKRGAAIKVTGEFTRVRSRNRLEAGRANVHAIGELERRVGRPKRLGLVPVCVRRVARRESRSTAVEEIQLPLLPPHAADETQPSEG